MTKSEFIERIAETSGSTARRPRRRGRGGARRDRRLAEGRRRGELHRFGKFSVNERGPRQGVNPRTGERITIPGGKVPKFSAGAGLKSAVKGS